MRVPARRKLRMKRTSTWFKRSSNWVWGGMMFAIVTFAALPASGRPRPITCEFGTTRLARMGIPGRLWYTAATWNSYGSGKLPENLNCGCQNGGVTVQNEVGFTAADVSATAE